MNRVYTGIGSRVIDPGIIPTIQYIGKLLSERGFILRSGGANGADLEFETAHGSGPKEIFLPWKKFNGNLSPYFKITDEAKEMAREYHPLGQELKHPALYLMARNCYQVLGLDLNTPTDFVVCVTPDEYHGGTSQALRICRKLGIPYFNIYHQKNIQNLAEFLKTY